MELASHRTEKDKSRNCSKKERNCNKRKGNCNSTMMKKFENCRKKTNIYDRCYRIGVEEITPEQSSLSLTTSLKLFITELFTVFSPGEWLFGIWTNIKDVTG